MGSIKARFENIAKQKEEEDRKKAEEERERRQVKEKQEQDDARRKVEVQGCTFLKNFLTNSWVTMKTKLRLSLNKK